MVGKGELLKATANEIIRPNKTPYTSLLCGIS
jgi:hypothetical protein